MRVLLTGASGFLGQSILTSPAAGGMTFFCASRGRDVRTAHDIPLGSGSWGQAEFERALEISGADTVLHCIGATHAADARQLFEANTLPAAGLLAAVARRPIPPRVILVGSAAEYGFVDADAMPVREEYPCLPRSDYGISKYAQTLMGLAAAERGLPVMTVRLFNAVGLGMPPKLALPSFARRIIDAADTDGTISVGDIEASRDFIDVHEAARIILALAVAPQWPWPLVNLCSGRAYQIGSLLEMMIAANGRPLQMQVDPALLRPGDMPLLIGSTERLSSLGLSPSAPDFGMLIPRLLAEARP